MMAAILKSAILDPAILHKKNFPLSFWLNLMMMTILNSAILESETAILDSDTVLFSLRFTQKHSHCTLTPTQTNSIWLKLFHSHSTWWFQPSWILPSFIQPFCTKKLYSIILTQLVDGSHLEIFHLGFSHFAQKRISLMHSPSNLWWQPSWIFSSWILSSWIQPFCTKFWLKLIQYDSNSFILTELDDGSHLEFCHIGFSHFAQKKFPSFILTQLDDGSHLEFCHVWFRHCHVGFKHIVIFSQIYSKPSFPTLTPTQTNSIWLTWWWQQSWIFSSWILSS